MVLKQKEYTLIATDSKPCIRGTFRGIIGVAILVKDVKAFEDFYHNYFDQLLNRLGIKRERKVYKSYDVAKLFGDNNHEEFLNFLEEFVGKVGSTGIKIHITYSSFNEKLIEKGVKFYGIGKSVKVVKPAEFINKLSQYFPYICIWKILKKKPSINSSQIYMDSFIGEITHAWQEVAALDLNILPRGDQCNCFISTADIICKFIDKFLYKNKLRLHEKDLEKLFEKIFTEVEIDYCGHPDLRNIVPVFQRSIPLERYYKRPMAFMLQERVLNNEKSFIEGSPFWDKVLNFVSSMNSGIKHISYSEDHKNIRNGDFLLYVGEEGKKQAEYLRKLGYNFNLKSIEEL